MASFAPDTLLASRLSLPESPCIYYVLLKPTSGVSPVESIENARRSILNAASSGVLDSVLSSVQISEDSFIYLFRLSQRLTSGSLDDLFGCLDFKGLEVHESSSFELPLASSLLPLPEIRQHLAHFYDALRCRIIQDIVDVSLRKPSLAHRHIKRFKNGFLMSQASSPYSQDGQTITRPLLFCQLQVHFSYSKEGIPSHILIHPVLQPTPFLDFTYSSPVSQGAPITLLPFGTPAYFLADYNGPVAGLVKQFQASLQGLGAGTWACSPAFLIAWIKIENKQGEDKGLTVIYPASLCLTCLPLSSPRLSLDYIPELPTPLQPSPQATHANLSARRLASSPIHSISRPALISSPTSESLFSFRALTLSSQDLSYVANEVGGYVETVAREREKERERLKKEREQGPVSSPKASRTSVSTPGPQSVDPSTPTPTPAQSQPPAQSFYPSPPQTTPNAAAALEVKTSPPIVNHPLPGASVNQELPATPILPVAAHTSTNAPFNSYAINSSWTQSSNNYLEMDLDNMDFDVGDIGLSFDMDMTTLENTQAPTSTMSFDSSGGAVGITVGMEFEDAFTDDDFSFFDRPSRVPQFSTTANQTIATASSLSSHLLHSTPLSIHPMPSDFGNLTTSSHPPPTSHAWTSNGFIDGLTPRSMVDHTDSAPPDLIPPSQGNTPENHPTPPTPSLQVNFDADVVEPSASMGSSKFFEPIPFARQHTSSDGKYAAGKFSLPSPPPEDDQRSSISISLPASPSAFVLRNKWKLRYNSATDPRLMVVQRLAGAKRKTPPMNDETPPTKRALWSSSLFELEDSERDDEPITTIDDSESEHEEEWVETESLPASRPVTPPPSYLPLGPTLVPTHFSHNELLPLSSPLRPPGSSISPLDLSSNSNNPIPSVPTPVSPATHLGTSAERTRSLEAAAFAVASEIVDNPLWAASWRTNVVGQKYSETIWPVDIKLVKSLLEHSPGWQGASDFSSIFGPVDHAPPTSPINDVPKVPGRQQPLEAPMLSVGKGETVIQVLPSALRFWEKLGLSPKSGRKDVSVFVLFEEDGQKQPVVQAWLTNLISSYQGKNYGSMVRGCSGHIEGLMALHFDSTFRKSLNLLIQGLPESQEHVVIILVLPLSFMTLSSSIFRQILSLTKKAQSQDRHLLFQFVPEQHIFSGMEKVGAYHSVFDILSTSVYNKVYIAVNRLQSRTLTEFDHLEREDIQASFVAPAFTLSRPGVSKVTLVHTPRASLDVIDRHMLLHVGYHLTACGKWIIACCIDQRGENHRIGVWLTQSPMDQENGTNSDELYAVKKVWDFGMEFGRRTDIEWRVVFSRLGVPSEREIEAWSTHLDHQVSSYRGHPPLHHTLLCVVPDAPWFFVSPKRSVISTSRPLTSRNSSSRQLPIFADTSTTTFAVYGQTHLPTSTLPGLGDLGISQALIPEPSGHLSETHLLDTHQPSLKCYQSLHSLPIYPRSTSILIHRSYGSTTKTQTASMTQIHLLHTYHSSSYMHSSQSFPGSTSAAPSDEQLLTDVTRNFHELAVLSDLRWHLSSADQPSLPFHLAATDAIRMALDMDWDRLDSFTDS